MVERLLTNLHGVAAFAYLAALIHLAWYLRKYKGAPKKPVRLMSHIMLVSAIAATVTAWLIYPPYRIDIKPELAMSPLRWVANLFDVKEHLGFFALAVSVVGWIWIGQQRKLEEPMRSQMNPAPLIRLNLGLVLATAALGILVGAYRNF